MRRWNPTDQENYNYWSMISIYVFTFYFELFIITDNNRSITSCDINDADQENGR